MMAKELPNIDLHIHTLYSDGTSNVEDAIRQAASNGLEAIAITDHYHMIGTERFGGYVSEIVSNSKRAPLRVLVGLEIHLQGASIPLIGKNEHGIDLVLADPIGGGADGLKELRKNQILEYFAEAYSSICKNPEVDIIAHPLNLGRFDQFRLFSDIDPWLPEHLIKKAKEGNKYLEVMSGMSWWFPHSEVDRFTEEYAAFIRHGFDEGVSFSIGSDAHCVHGVGNTVWSRKILSSVGATCDDIIKV